MPDTIGLGSAGVITVGQNALISFYATRAQEIALAAQQTAAVTKAITGANAAQISLGGRDFATRTITLELTQRVAQTNSNNTVTQIPNADNLKTIAQVKAPKSTTVAMLTFDIGPSADGFAQTIDIVANARQTVHQTAVGFYVDEFNQGTGTLSIDVDVLFGQTPAAQIQAFFDLLQKAKLTDPLANEPPLRLRYFDSYTDKTLEITQDSIRMRQDVERPNRARLQIAATVLYDYSSSNIVPPTEPSPSENLASLANLISSFGS